MEAIKLIRKLREKAERLLKYAEEIGNREGYTFAIFLLEQALQLLLKSKLLETKGTFPKTHNLKILLSLLSENYEELKSYVDSVEVEIY